jgi:hypothetical protein
MGKSERVRFADLRRAYRLIHECRDLGQDVALWSHHTVDNLSRFVCAQVGVLTCIRSQRAKPVGPQGLETLCDLGWSSPKHRSQWQQHYTTENRFQQAITFQRFVALPGRLVTRTRDQLAEDAE